jgi:hypothetical protein
MDTLRRWFGRAALDAEEVAEGGEPAATESVEQERETSTNAQTAGASDEPWPGND